MGLCYAVCRLATLRIHLSHIWRLRRRSMKIPCKYTPHLLLGTLPLTSKPLSGNTYTMTQAASPVVAQSVSSILSVSIILLMALTYSRLWGIYQNISSRHLVESLSLLCRGLRLRLLFFLVYTPCHKRDKTLCYRSFSAGQSL